MAVVTALDCPVCNGMGFIDGIGDECTNCGGSGEAPARTGAMPGMPPTTTEGLPLSEAARQLTAAQEDPVSQALAVVTQHTNTILTLAARGRELHAKYKDVAFNVATTKGMEDARKARAALRDEARYPIQKIKDERSKILGTMQRQANQSADALIAEIIGYEKPIDDQITAEETRKEDERKAREAADAARVQKHLNAIAAISQEVALAAGETSAEIQARVTALLAMILDASAWEEFHGQALQARDEAMRQLNGLLIAARAEEAELEQERAAQARLHEAQEAERARLAAEGEAQAARQRALDAQAATIRQQQEAMDRRQRELDEQAAQQARARAERAQAINGRLLALQTAGEPLDGRTAAELTSIRNTLLASVISTDLFDDYVSDGVRCRDERAAHIAELIAAATEREADEARQKRADEVQARLDDLRGMGENAVVSAEEGTIFPGHIDNLRTGLEALEALACTPGLFDDRAQEAEAARGVSIIQIQTAIQRLEECEAKAAAEAEERRKQEAEQAAARAKYERALRRLPELQLVLADVTAELATYVTVEQYPPLAVAQRLVAEIEGPPPTDPIEDEMQRGYAAAQGASNA